MTSNRASLWSTAFWLLLIGTALAAAAHWTWGVHQTALQQLETIEPRYARLVGLGADQARLKDLAAQAARAIERHAYPGSRDASQAGNEAQQRVRDVFSKAGLDVVSIQVLPARSSKQFDRVPITLRVDGELASMQATLAALPTLSPTLFVESVTFQSASSSETAPARVVAELQLFVLRVRP